MFRFTNRDVLWLTVVAALTVGWWIDHSGRVSLSKALNAASAKLEELGYSLSVEPDGTVVVDDNVSVHWSPQSTPDSGEPENNQ